MQLHSRFSGNRWLYFISSAVIILGFHMRYGIDIILPQNINWLLSVYHDWGQHYLGWAYFRNEPWTFPLGTIENFTYPSGTNVGYMDSIPLLALFFKLFSFILPETFQYLGIYMLVSHVLAGVYTVKLLRVFRTPAPVILLSAILIGLSPLMIFRDMHPATTAHWLILASLLFYLKPVDKDSVVRRNYKQVILVIAAGLINPYLFAMTVGFALILPLRNFLFDKLITWQKALYFFFLSIAGTVFSWFMLGMIGFNSDVDMEVANGYGIYGTNLDTFFSSYGFSSFLPAHDNYDIHQYEGFAYMGVGLLILLPLCYGYWLVQAITKKERFRLRKEWIPLLLLVVATAVFSITHRITYGDKILTEIPIPELLMKIGNVFRASGRFIWLTYYVLILGAFIILGKVRLSTPVKTALLSIVLLIQFYDMKPFFPGPQFPYGDYSPAPLNDEKWLTVTASFDRIITYPPFDNVLYPSDYQDLCFIALKNSKPISTGYVAREKGQLNRQFTDSLNKELAHGIIDTGSLFITSPKYLDTFYPLIYDRTLEFEYMDGYYCLYAYEKSLPGNPAPTELAQSKKDSILEEVKRFSNSYRVIPVAEIQEGIIRKNIENFTYVNHFLRTNGWAFAEGQTNSANDSVFIGLVNNGQCYLFSVHVAERKDVTSYFQAENLDNAGFHSTSYTHGLPNGDYDFGLIIKKGDGSMIREMMPDFSPLHIAREMRPEEITDPSFISSAKVRCNIEAVERREDVLVINGWAILPGQDAKGMRIDIILFGGETDYTIAAQKVNRPDVTTFFNNGKNYDESGFEAKVHVNQLRRGTYTLGILIKSGDDNHLYLSKEKIMIKR